jgi:hypothetical protein
MVKIEESKLLIKLMYYSTPDIWHFLFNDDNWRINVSYVQATRQVKPLRVSAGLVTLTTELMTSVTIDRQSSQGDYSRAVAVTVIPTRTGRRSRNNLTARLHSRIWILSIDLHRLTSAVTVIGQLGLCWAGNELCETSKFCLTRTVRLYSQSSWITNMLRNRSALLNPQVCHSNGNRQIVWLGL